jgi:hypothetical protein
MNRKTISEISANQCYALVIGIDYIKTPEIRLNGCCADAYNMKEMLLNRFGFLNENIMIFTDDNTNITKESNTKNIEDALKYLAEKSLKEAKFIVVFYSGHGTQMLDDDNDKDFEIDGKDECWIFTDYKTQGFFTDDKLKINFLDNLGASVNVLIISDSCHSGSMADLSWTYNSSTKKIKNTKTNVDNKNPNIWQISGCMDPQYSEELAINGRVCGALTHCMNEFLVKGKKIKDILNLSQSACRKLKLSQIPVLSCNKKELLDYML